MSESKKPPANLTEAKRAALAELIRRKAEEAKSRRAPIARVERGTPQPLSYAQERLWFLDQLEPGGTAYHLLRAVRLRGMLDIAALGKSLDAIVQRHESLRTRVVTAAGRGKQVVDPPGKVTLRVEAVRGEDLVARVRAETRRPFDLATEPLFRALLLEEAAHEHVLVVTMHHIVSDGWSQGVLIGELGTLYAAYAQGKEPELSPLPVQYVDYAAWQRAWLERGELEKQLGYWRTRLSGAPALSTIPTDRPRPIDQSHLGARVPISLGPQTSAGLRRLCEENGITPFMAILTGLSLVLARYSGQRDVVIGTAVANRRRKEVEGLVGFFVNTLPLRVEVGANESVKSLLARVKETTLGAYEHQDAPFEKVVDAVGAERSLTHAPLFQVMLVLQNNRSETMTLPGVELSGVALEAPIEQFDLTLELAEDAAGYAGSLSFATALYDRQTIERVAQHLLRTFEEMQARPDAYALELRLLSDGEQRQQLVEWNDASGAFPENMLVHELFAEQARQTPDAVAGSHRGATLTYRELDERANQLAHHLQAQGVGPEVRVAVCMERSLEMLVAQLGILKAGGAYVPLDPSYPEERLAHMRADSAARVELDGRWPDLTRHPKTAPVTATHPANLAYVIYTSGSTGRSKGVLIAHRGVLNLVTQSRRDLPLRSDSRVLQFASPSFDTSVGEIFPTLLSGARLCLLDGERTTISAEELLGQLERDRITVAWLPPALLGVLKPRPGLALETLITAGEACPPEVVRRWSTAGLRFINEYGPTESTVCVTRALLQSNERPPPIGRPIANSRLYVLDDAAQLVPIGVAGELCIAGVQLARGYLNRPELTAEKLVPNPFSTGERMYRTGDLARWLPTGELEYLGRIDHQVKVRGFRIELGEVEAVLMEQPGVRAAVVVAREDIAGQKRLVGYVVGEVDSGALRSALSAKLPEYMVPALVVLDALPLSSNGKIDRKALPAPDFTTAASASVAPRTEMEEKLATVWKEVLRIERVGIRDQFFELGGDSILSIQVVSRARAAGVHVTPKQIFEHPRLEALAKVASLSGATLDAEQGLVTGRVERTPIEGWFFAHGADEDPHHYNQAVLLRMDAVDDRSLETALDAVARHHDALRLRYRDTKLLTATYQPVQLELVDAQDVRALELHATTVQQSLRLDEGPLLRAVRFDLGEQGKRLLIVIHHVAVDGVSWRVLLSDLESAYEQARTGQRIALPDKTTSVKAWAAKLSTWARGEDATKALPFWRAQGATTPPLPTRAGRNLTKDAVTHFVELTEADTDALLRDVPAAYRTQVNDALLLAVTEAFEGWTGSSALRIELEGHGREDLFADVDLSRTVGWFTSLFPVTIDVGATKDVGARLKAVKEKLRAVPHRGLSYGALRYLGSEETRAALAMHAAPEVSFNYLGQLDQALAVESRFAGAAESAGPAHSAMRSRDSIISLNASVSRRRLGIALTYPAQKVDADTMKALGDKMRASLLALIAHCRAPNVGGYTPSDFPLARVSQAWLDEHVGRGDNVEDLYALSPMQEGMLFEALRDPESETAFEQLGLRIEGGVDAGALEHAWQAVVDRHDVLRTSLRWEGLERPVQLVHRRARVPFERATLASEEALAAWKKADRKRGFDLTKAPLMRVALLTLPTGAHELVWSSHHAVLDGWCLPIVMNDVLRAYEAYVQSGTPDLAAPPKYRDYIAWLGRNDEQSAERYFRTLLEGFATPTVVGIAKGHFGATLEQHGTLEHRLDEVATQRLKNAAQQLGLTVNTLTQAAWGLLLAHYSGANDVVFGSVGSGRPAELPGVERMVGLFINTLPVRVRVGHETRVLQVLETLQAQQVETRRYEATPLAKVQRWSEIERNQPLFETLYAFESYPIDETLDERANALRVASVEIFEQTSYALVLTVLPGRTLGLRLAYDTDRFEPPAVERMLAHYVRLVDAICSQPEATALGVELLSSEERREQLVAWNDTDRLYDRDVLVQARFAQHAQATPDAIAISYEGATLTYRELDERSNQLAHALQKRGVGPDVLVAVSLPRSLELVVTLLGILKAGGAYVPLDPSYPDERRAYMRSDSGATIVLDENSPGFVHEPTTTPWSAARSSNLAYVIYTSGSTGQPKGVAVTHRGLMNLVHWHEHAYEVVPSDRASALASIGFDASAWELWPYLCTGARVHVLSEEERIDAVQVVEVLEREDITVAFIPTPLMKSVVAHSARLPRLRWMLTGGDRLETLPLRDASFRVVNNYGPTENTVVSTFAVLDDADGTPPIGRPTDNVTTYVLDAELALVPVGVSGELCVAGAQLARGYLGRAALTADKFVPNPFVAGERMYRTGDLVRWNRHGLLEYLGRIDHQVKVRGFRIELGEIEAALAGQPGVQAAVVVAREDVPGHKRLVGYITGDVDPRTLKEALGKRLPEYMVPSAFVVLDALPLTANGKIDRKALPAPEHERARHVAPRTPVEQQLSAIWQEVLGVTNVGVTDDFFELGGHSLIATRLASQVRAQLGAEFSVRAVFELPTIEAQANAISLHVATATVPLVRRPRDEALPLSYAQERLWFLDRLEPGNRAYNMPLAVRLDGRLDLDALRAALYDVVQRHEALRTTFPTVNGRPTQRIAALLEMPLVLADLAELPRDRREAEATRVVDQEVRATFDLVEGPLIRAALVRLDENEHVLAVTMHHIVSDGWSTGIFIEELAMLYRAHAHHVPTALPALPLQYADFAAWQREWLAGDELERQLAYWRTKLHAPLPLLDLPFDAPRALSPTYEGAFVSRRLGMVESAALAALCQREGATLFMALLAGFSALLGRLSGQDDVVVGAPIANRTRPETERLIGFFVNTLVLRTDLSGDPSFTQLLRRAKETTLGAYENQDVPFEKLVEELRPERVMGRTPLFEVMLNLINVPTTTVELDELSLTSVSAELGTAKFSLTLYVSQLVDGDVAFSLAYQREIISEARATLFVEQLTQLLGRAVASPDAPMASHAIEVVGGRVALAAPAAAYAGPLVHEALTRSAAAHPHRPAVRDAAVMFTYEELEARSNRLAHGLIAQGIGRGDVVAIHAVRSAALVSAMVGVLKAGAAFTLLDSHYPPARLVRQLRLARPKCCVVLAVAGTSESVPAYLLEERVSLIELDANGETPALAACSDRLPSNRAAADDVAYIAFTSGTTGTPKGIVGTHGPLAHFVRWHTTRFELSAGDRFSMLSGLAHDPLLRDVFSPLWCGAELLVPEQDALIEPAILAKWMIDRDVTAAHATPAMAQMLADGARQCGLSLPLRYLFCAGEQLTGARAQAVFRCAPRCTIVNFYGTTETPQAMGYYVVPRDFDARQLVPVGRGIDEVDLVIVAPSGQIAAPGEVGEICVRTLHLARGYLQSVDDSLAFVRDMFTPGDRVYRTGDLGRYALDGNILCLGRRDQQVKARGYRIELGEVEGALLQAGAREAAVVARQDSIGEQQIVAYVTGAEKATLIEVLSAQLPSYMVPSVFVVLDAMPLTPNGKLDRSALPAPMHDDNAYIAPRTLAERNLATIWQEVLRVERVGARDHFFRLGGHSLLAMQLVSSVRSALGVELPVRAVFESPTVEALATRIERLGAEVPEGLRLPMGRIGNREGDVLSFAQERLWFLDQLEPGSVAYHIPAVVRLRGALDVSALASSLELLVRRHESLRTRIVTEAGRGKQVVDEPGGVMLRVQPARKAEVSALVRDELRRPFDLSTGPLFRALLLVEAADEHVLAVTMHHIVSDGWSMGVLIDELGSAYTAYAQSREPELPALPVQYIDYAVWQRAWLERGELEKQLGYWKALLADAPALSTIPTDRPRPTQQSHRGARIPVVLGRETSERLRRLCDENGLTPFMAILGALGLVLAKYSGQTDVVVGTAVANRRRKEVEGLVGFFVNTLALRVNVGAEETVRELLARVKEQTLATYACQDTPFEKVVDVIGVERTLTHAPLFQVMLLMQNTRGALIELPGVELSGVALDATTEKFDLTLELGEGSAGFAGTLGFATDLYDTVTIERVAQQLVRTFEAMVERPDEKALELRTLAEEERRRQLVTWNGRQRVYDEVALLHELFVHEAQRSPSALAVAHDGATLTYRELDERSNQLAHHLQARGVGPDVRVAVCMERSLDMVVALFGVLKSGGAYVPLDPSYPEERLHYMRSDSGAKVVLDRKLPDISGQPKTSPPNRARASNIAYVIYTSGSTGVPKGVAATHVGLGNRMRWMLEALPFGRSDVACQKTTIAFVDSLWEVLGPLSAGRPLVVLDDDVVRDTARFLEALAMAKVTRIVLVPSLLRAILDAEGAQLAHRLPALDTWSVSGEALDADLAHAFERCLPGRRLINLYGSSEVAADVTADLRVLAGSVAIGRPIDNVGAYVLSRSHELLPMGVQGELYVGGKALARGYLGRPDFTAERFVPNPFIAGERMYRTGDVVRWRSTGELEYLGRIDHQVKIRGFRIELGEVESTLREQAGVRAAVVMAREDLPGQKRLVGYAESDVDGSSLRAALATKLPEYMVPSVIVVLSALPLTPNGKIDRKALPAPDFRAETTEYVAPRTEAEAKLALVWQEVLRLPRVGAHDHFFDLGGDSILSIQVVSRARAVGVHVTPKQVFEYPRLDALAKVAATGDAGHGRPLVEKLSPRQVFAASLYQRRMWKTYLAEPETLAFNLPYLVELPSDTDVALLERCLNEVALRQDVLRSTFRGGPDEPQVIVHHRSSLSIASDPDVFRGSMLDFERVLHEEWTRRFDLVDKPGVRVRYWSWADGRVFLLLTLHHIISDRWSIPLIVRELSERYAFYERGEQAHFPELPLSYADFAAWQERVLTPVLVEEQSRFWQNQLAGCPPVTLRVERAREPSPDEPNSYSRKLDPLLFERITVLCKQADSTLFMVLLGAYAILLAEQSGEREQVIGYPIVDRPDPRLEQVVGYFINHLCARIVVDANATARELLAAVRANVLGTRENQDISLDMCLSREQRARLYQYRLNIAPTAPTSSTASERRERAGGSPRLFVPSPFTLSFDVSTSAAGTSLSLRYDTRKLSAEAARQLFDRMVAILESISGTPDAVVGSLQPVNGTR